MYWIFYANLIGIWILKHSSYFWYFFPDVSKFRHPTNLCSEPIIFCVLSLREVQFVSVRMICRSVHNLESRSHKKRKAPFSHHDCPSDESVHMYRRGFHRTDFRETWYWELVMENLSGKLGICLKSDKIMRRFKQVRLYFWQQYEIFCSSNRARRETIVAILLQYSPVLYCW